MKKLYSKLNILYLNNLITPTEYTKLELLCSSKFHPNSKFALNIIDAKLKKYELDI
jgi:hypothetical protein